MKESTQNLIASLVILIIGIAALLYGNSINIPSAYRTFLGIPYQVNPQYVSSLSTAIIFYALGIFILGVSVGGFSATYSIYRVERQLESIPPPINTQGKLCPYCRTENENDAVYCKKCGNKSV